MARCNGVQVEGITLWLLGGINILLAVFNVIPEARSPCRLRPRSTGSCPLAEVARATPDEPVADLLPRLNAYSDDRALVFADGQLGIKRISDALD